MDPSFITRVLGFDDRRLRVWQSPRMDDFGIAIRPGDFHSRRLVAALGLQGDGGVLRVLMLHCDTQAQVGRLTDALSQIIAEVPP
jgi:hypothetical protein